MPTAMADRTAGAFLLLAILLAGCSSANDDPPGTERITRGDTMIVRTTGPGVWQSATLVEELRIGALEGEDHEMFGTVSDLVPDGNGGVYVFDGLAPALRHYDAHGTYTGTFGGPGAGPGEYRDAVLGLAVLRDGRVLMRDPRNSRINVYSSTGESLDSWPVASGLHTSNSTVVDTAGEIWLKILLGQPEPNQPWPVALMHYSRTGEVLDTLVPPTLPREPTNAGGVFVGSKEWEMSPLGHLVIGVNDRYTFELREQDGSIVRIERDHEPVRVHPEERSQWEARNEYTRRTQGQFLTAEIPPVPGTKPAFRSFDIGLDGLIWVRPYVASEPFEPSPPAPRPDGSEPPPPLTWREPVMYDVFEPDGTYFGRVHMPQRTSLLAHNGGEVWATVRGEFDELSVVRFRLDTTIEP
jgi:hypothetical protein